MEVTLGVKIRLVLAAALLCGALFFGPNVPFQSTRVSAMTLAEWEAEWNAMAAVAWRYYAPGVGVHSVKGLHKATLGWNAFTSWDLATYIVSIISAEGLGLPDAPGWGADYRIGKILDFLESRSLNPDGVPFWAYRWDTGGPLNTQLSHPSDTGRLLVGLYILSLSRPGLYPRIANIVHNITNFDLVAQNYGSAGFYQNYACKGFEAWGFGGYSRIQNCLNSMETLEHRATVDVYGQSLPKADMTAEPILHALLEELEMGATFEDYAFRLYKTQEARRGSLGVWTAWTEGAYDSTPYYFYEWVVRGNGDTWVIMDASDTEVGITPIVYLKAAVGWHALFPSTYTKQLTDVLLPQLETSSGYKEAVQETGRVVSTTSDKTNGMILSAAYYALTYGMNRRPITPRLTYPTGGELVSGVATVIWEASVDPNGDPVLYDVDYSPNGGADWFVIATGIAGTSTSWDTSAVSDGSSYLARVQASDGALNSYWDQSDQVFRVSNHGKLKVETSPAVPATLYIDGVPVDPWGLDYLPMSLGSYRVRFGDVPNYVTPPPQMALISPDQVTVARGDYTRAGFLKVETNPAVSATIYVEGSPRAVWGLDFLPLAPGDYWVRFGDVEYFVTPPDQLVTVVADQVTVATGDYIRAGLLKIETSPAVPGVIYVDGSPRAVWGLDYLPVPPGDYAVSFGDVDGYTTPSPEIATVADGVVTTVVGVYAEAPGATYPQPPGGLLKIETSPAVPATLYIDGVPVDPWGLEYLPLPVEQYTVRFGDVPYYVTPVEEVVTIQEGVSSLVIGGYTRAGLLKIETDPPVPATLYLDGVPVDPWGLDFLPLAPGDHTVSFGDVPYYFTPQDVTVSVQDGLTTVTVGSYVRAGLLKVETSPAVPGVIYVDGVARAVWGLDYLPLPPGDYTISFGEVDGFTRPSDQVATVVADAVTVVVGNYS